MREGTKTEFQERRNRPHVEVKMMSTKRTFDVQIIHQGEVIAWKTETLTRGKITSTHILVAD